MDLGERKLKQQQAIEERKASCKELPVLQRDHDTCVDCGFQGCQRKFQNEDTDLLHLFCKLE